MPTRRTVLSGGFSVAGLCAAPAIVRGNPWGADRALLFALDMSGSTAWTHPGMEGRSIKHWPFQVDGHVQALLHEEIVELLIANKLVTAIAAVAWSGPDVASQTTGEMGQPQASQPSWVELVPWTFVTVAEDVFAFATALARHRGLVPRGGTNHMTALLESRLMFRHEPIVDTPRKMLDFSTDQAGQGLKNPYCILQRDKASREGITINALAVRARRGPPTWPHSTIEELAETQQDDEQFLTWLRDNVVTPPPRKGFAMMAHGYRHFAMSLKRKIKKELLV